VARLRLRTAQLEAALLAAQQSSSVPIPSPSVAHSGISGVQPLASLLPAYSGVLLQSRRCHCCRLQCQRLCSRSQGPSSPVSSVLKLRSTSRAFLAILAISFVDLLIAWRSDFSDLPALRRLLLFFIATVNYRFSVSHGILR
jgi:hypothetical protein